VLAATLAAAARMRPVGRALLPPGVQHPRLIW
jgi:hypothetical protein